MNKVKNIAVVAHDNCKEELLDFVDCNRDAMLRHNLVATGTTGRLVESLLAERALRSAEGQGMKKVTRLKSGPLGGDQQLGALIADGKVDILIFFWDPMEPQPHDVDVKALLRLAVLYNLPTASNRSSAEFLISSVFFDNEFSMKKSEFFAYADRSLD
ncbi:MULTISPECIES: methylglyoxal synthase [unclassified Pseudodesulfovibrio]|uniref:methylglyoxal synthase n=1 Tax=unclassified Pseudodesulfovibrio TaxID=2661612 RepID=UPI000FEBEA95|nr:MULTISPECIES: methylglyoxal synthase [unclassified Pseudodesulfovibrio]MCJ2164307.1 methylglyoxal synthase [Pseudodesulfovibrio sp. S3-i]RWU04518.1 methylglyoxal synthase [Pseudodesulfovibrio sp. S3]